MRVIAFKSALLLLAGCAGGTQYVVVNGTSPAAPPDAFECVRNQLKTLGWQQTSVDINDRRVTAKKFNDKVTRPDVQFRRLVERLSIEVAAGASGQTTMKIEAHTFSELGTQKGPTEVEEQASDSVKAAAATIAQICASQ
jgi:hypothetical protein